MKGTVKFFNVVKGVGFLTDKDKRDYFVHFNEIRGNGFKFLFPGEEVEFTPLSTQEQVQAIRVQPPKERRGVKTKEISRLAGINQKGSAQLLIDALGRIYSINGVRVSPSIEAEGHFRAYYVGEHPIRGFDFILPESSSERAFVLLDPQKNPRRIKKDGEYQNVPPGSYIIKVETSGRVRIQCFGRRYQPPENWLVLQRRFEHTYKNIIGISAEEIDNQTPTSGLARDNDGFVRGILRGIEWIRTAQKEDAEAATAS